MKENIHQSEDTLKDFSSIAIALGTFDGVHVAHQKLLSECVAYAKKHNATPMAYCFKTPPADCLQQRQSVLLSTTEEKMQQIFSLGIEEILLIDFNLDYATASPQSFIERLCQYHNINAIFIGYDYKFGYQGQGNAKLLEEQAKNFGYSAHILSEVIVDHIPVSSTAARKALAMGDLAKVALLLGREYTTPATFIDSTMQKVSFVLAEKAQPKDGLYDITITVLGESYRMQGTVSKNTLTTTSVFLQLLQGQPVKITYHSRIDES